jgi:hypothetical protein
MTIAFLTSTSAESSNSNGFTTSAINTTGADLIVIAQNYYFELADPANPSDSKGNTWTLLGTATATGPYYDQLKVWACFNPTTDASHTFSMTTGSTYGAMAVAAYSGTDAFETYGANAIAGVSQINTGSYTPAANGELVIAALGRREGVGSVTTDDSNFTVIEQQDRSANALGMAYAHSIQTAAAAVNPKFIEPPPPDSVLLTLILSITAADVVEDADFDIGDVDLALSGALAIPAGTVSIFDTSDEFTLDNPLSMALQGALAMEGDIDFGVSRLALGNVSLALSGALAVPAGSIDYHVPIDFDIGDVDLALSGALHVTGIVHSKTDAVISSALIRRRSRRR